MAPEIVCDDLDDNLCRIVERDGSTLLQQVLALQGHAQSDQKRKTWATHLQFLCQNKRGPSNFELVRTHWSQHANETNYIAVSYTWCPSRHESADNGGYMIRDTSTIAKPCAVRDCVMQRVFAFAVHSDTDLVWIDQECIDQKNPQEKKIGMECMDIVYGRSRFPLGVIAVPLNSQDDLDGLTKLMTLDPKSHASHKHLPHRVLQFLESVVLKILSDSWWDRAWIYQEEYRSSGKMSLLIPHDPNLRKNTKVFGRLFGELIISSRDFRTSVTTFALICRSNGYMLDEEVLQKATQYNIMHKQSAAGAIRHVRFYGLTATILSDISRRKCKNRSDLLAIIANCCAYAIRLDSQQLSDLDRCSLSACIITLFFLNGELFWNGRGTLPWHTRRETAIDFLRRIALRLPPSGHQKQLTLMKRFRFPQVNLCRLGVESSGWLWELRQPIRFHCTKVVNWRRRWSRSQSSKIPLSVCRKQLRTLALYLRQQEYHLLAADIDNWSRRGRDHLPSGNIRSLTAIRLLEQLERGKIMRLGAVRGEKDCRALFLADPHEHRKYMLMLTCWSANDGVIDKYVSLQVKQTGTHDGRPLLETVRWADGFWFAERHSRKEIVMTWPCGLY